MNAPTVKIPSLKEIVEKYNLGTSNTKTDTLIDKTFVIDAVKPFNSRFGENAHSYFITAHYPETGEVFTTVLGGTAVVDTLDKLGENGVAPPYEVTLRQINGGKFGRYYTLE